MTGQRSRTIIAGAIALALGAGLISSPALAQHITTDGSVGQAGTLLGPNYVIPADLGQTRGANLFHSFETFSVLTGESANFTGPNSISNIFSRVTGGSLSTIDGQITSSIPHVNLFLLNPAGVLFGPNASINLGGSFRVTTADYVRFVDGYRFNATVGADGNFTSAPYAAFGFLSANPAPITFDRSTITVTPGSTLAVVGGDMTLSGPPRSGAQTLQAQSGEIHLISVASAGEVPLVATATAPAFSVDGFARLGTITLNNGATVAAPPTAGNATPGGRILMRGGTLTMDQNSAIFATTGGDVSAPPVALDIAMREAIILDRGSVITANNVGGLGNGGAILLSAPLIALRNNAALSSVYLGNGNGSDLTIQAGQLLLTGGADIIARNLGSRNAGNGGMLTIAATESMSLGPGSTIQAENFQGLGSGSSIHITTPHLVVEGAAGATGQAGISGFTGGFGPASSVTLNVGTLELTGQQALIDTRARNVSIVGGGVPTEGGGPITVQGQGGPGTLADLVRVSGQGSGFLTESEGAGTGGTLQLSARQIVIQNEGRISANTIGSGQAGAVVMNAGELSVTGGGRIESNTSGIGDGGTIAITTTGDVFVTGGGRVESNTSGAGDGGTIAITTTGDVSVAGLSANGQTRSGIFAKTLGTVANAGAAGDITVSARNISLSAGSQIDSSTTSGGAGGVVSLVAADQIAVTGASTRITSDASRGNGTGGNITMQAGNIAISDGASVTAETGGSGDAGNVTITARGSVALDSGATITTGTSGSGRGGSIAIQAFDLLLDGSGTAIKADTLRPFADMVVGLGIAHANVGDLVAILESPDGTRVALFSRVGGAGDNFTGTVLSDEATTPIASGAAPFTGQFLPREPLAQLNDQLANGTWKLNVRDQTGGAAGSLLGWSLRIGDQTFQSTGPAIDIPNNGAIASSVAVNLGPGAVVPGTGEIAGIGGNVTVNAGTLTVQNGAQLSATTRGSGHGGTLNITTTGATSISGTGSGLFSDAHASGVGGDITVKAGTMTLGSGATVSASSLGSGDAGSITIQTAGLLQITGGSVKTTAVTGKGGDISITAGEMALIGAAISASSRGPGNAGNITIDSGTQFISTASRVTTEATQASGGNITLNAKRMIRLTGSQVSTSVAGGPTTAGGNIAIDPDFVIMQNSQIVAQAFQGQGGNITITAGTFLADPASLVDASSQLGVSGSVNIQAPVTNLSGAITPLSDNPVDAAALVRASCAARFASGNRSSLVQRGRDTLPADPGSGFMSGPLWASGGVVVAVLAELDREPSRLMTEDILASSQESQSVIRLDGSPMLEPAAYCQS